METLPIKHKEQTMTSKRAWETYPSTYRARDMALLAQWIRAGESGSVIGLPGAGKSNLLGFLSHRPEAVQSYLKDSSPKLALVLVDLNNLPDNDLATFFRVILRSLYEAGAYLAAQEESLAAAIETLYRKVEDKTDPFLAQSALREVLILCQAKNLRLVLVLDPFDQFCRAASTQVLDNLRGLRDSFKTTLSYLFGLRCEVGYIRSPIELGELYEIIDTHQCWLGAMEPEDSRWVISQVGTGTGQTFTEAQVEQLIRLTGGYPTLLRTTSLWLTRVSPLPKLEDWLASWLAEPGILSRLEDLRQGLTGEEEAALSVLQRTRQSSTPKDQPESLRQIGQKYQPVLERLQHKRLCQLTEAGWQLSNPLFASFVTQMTGISGGKIHHDPVTDRFFLGEQEITGLSDRDRRLLQYFVTHPWQVHSIYDLVEAAWSGDDPQGVDDAAVQQAIRHLRKQIEPNPAKPCYVVNERGAGYRFFPEGAPRG